MGREKSLFSGCIEKGGGSSLRKKIKDSSRLIDFLWGMVYAHYT